MAEYDYESLDRFFGNWFHQDWDLEASSWKELVDKFRTVSRKERVLQVHADLKAFLKQQKDDDALHDLVYEEFGCGYDPRPAQSVREWLTELAAALKAPRKQDETDD